MKAATKYMVEAQAHFQFQSTPPVKAATSELLSINCPADISIHAAREGGDVADGVPATFEDISIHAAREGGDTLQHLVSGQRNHFNPRRP